MTIAPPDVGMMSVYRIYKGSCFALVVWLCEHNRNQMYLGIGPGYCGKRFLSPITASVPQQMSMGMDSET